LGGSWFQVSQGKKFVRASQQKKLGMVIPATAEGERGRRRVSEIIRAEQG
jgi:hypothetical protein